MSGILFLGTSSDAGKTTVCAAICRILADRGMDPVPFKALNLSLNSYATEDGGEIGIGQAFQAWSCGLEPETSMNPVLLKPSGGGKIQLVLNGKPDSDMTADAPMDRPRALKVAVEAYRRLASEHRFVVCEGSGSPVEMNLMETDIANVGMMRGLAVPSVLVADIERGGVFAAIYGTWMLIPDDVRPQLKGFIINRFRGDATILSDGIAKVEELTGMKCLGVMPYADLRFPEEDSLSRSEGRLEGTDAKTAYIDNICELGRIFIDAGLDVDSIIRMMEDSSA